MKKIHLIESKKGIRMYATFCGEWYIHKDREKHFTYNRNEVDCENCLRVMRTNDN